MDVLVRVFRLEEQQLSHDQIGHVILNRTHKEDHPFLQQAGIDVIGPFAASILLDNHRNQTASILDVEVVDVGFLHPMTLISIEHATLPRPLTRDPAVAGSWSSKH